MAQVKQQLKFEINLTIRFWDNYDTADGWTTDGIWRTKSHTIRSADTVMQS